MEIKNDDGTRMAIGVGYGLGLVYGLMGGRYGFEDLDLVLVFASLGLYISKTSISKGPPL